VARTVQPFDDLGWVEANKVTDLEIGHTALGHKPADVAHRVTQEVRKGLYVDQFRHRCRHLVLRREASPNFSRSMKGPKRNIKSQKSSSRGFL
jgi:hypothetical protein